ncbi:MAG: M48 family metalloprotease [Chloroherpetonaceae bacterium]|nr:M48 family metalloprotease [Chloroherpetonaceae bacterium]
MFRNRLYPQSGSGFGGLKLWIAVAIAGFSIFSYLSKGDYNEQTGEMQFVSLSPKQEIALGLQSTPKLIAQYGGLHPDEQLQKLVDAIGNRLLRKSHAKETPYKFEFHLLKDKKIVNAFALPGGQVFITYALFSKLKTEGQIAGVLGHEIGHVIARHSAQRLAKAELTEGLTGAIFLATFDPDNPGKMAVGQMAAVAASLINMKYGREDELESDALGIRYMTEAGYNPNSMIEVMKVLEAASGGGRQPEFFSTHPNPENRVEKIQATIKKLYPKGLPPGLEN